MADHLGVDAKGVGAQVGSPVSSIPGYDWDMGDALQRGTLYIEGYSNDYTKATITSGKDRLGQDTGSEFQFHTPSNVVPRFEDINLK
jgi:hypothetical protein